MMKILYVVILMCLFIGKGMAISLLPEELKKDIFNIRKGIAVTVKEVTGTTVTLDEVTFTMFDKHDTENGTVINSTNLYLVKPTQDKIIFILHGWMSFGAADWVLDMKTAFLYAYPNSTVITVDWRGPAMQLYSISAINTYDVGNFVADMIISLIDNYNVDIKKFLLVGHSLGGQSCGFAGKKLKSVGKLLPRIVGLDPAGPLFSERPKDKRLNDGDATVVQIIHSNGGTFGFKEPCGTIDFFPNGGSLQPGCATIDLFDISSVVDPVTCDHKRAYEYFTEAILNPNDFVATMCTKKGLIIKKWNCHDDIQVPLGDLTTTLRGSFYFETNKEPPFAKLKQKKEGMINQLSKILKM